MRCRPYMIALDGPVDGQTEPTMHACAQHQDVAATGFRHGETHLPGEEYPVLGWGRTPADTAMAAIGVTRRRPWRRTWVAFLGTEAWAAEVCCQPS